MAEITLGDYTGYILREMVKARETADAYSRAVADRYAADPILQHFSVPRFKVPKMSLNIPILVSGARFTQAVRLDLPLEKFVASVEGRARDVVEVVAQARAGKEGAAAPQRAVAPPTDRLARAFHERLTANPDPLRPEEIVTAFWGRIFWTALQQAALDAFYRQYEPRQDLLGRTTREVVDMVRNRTVVDRTAIDSLLINPETNVVRNGGSEASVFTVNAELVEEGFYLRSVKDEETGRVNTIVEFD